MNKRPTVPPAPKRQPHPPKRASCMHSSVREFRTVEPFLREDCALGHHCGLQLGVGGGLVAEPEAPNSGTTRIPSTKPAPDQHPMTQHGHYEEHSKRCVWGWSGAEKCARNAREIDPMMSKLLYGVFLSAAANSASLACGSAFHNCGIGIALDQIVPFGMHIMIWNAQAHRQMRQS